jgi:UDP-glucuronate 4-epimerase
LTVLITGAAGFIGFHLAKRLLAEGRRVVGVDSLNDYYDPKLKEDRLALIRDQAGFTFYRADIADAEALTRIFRREGIRTVIHLAAQAGVRYSLINPSAYISSNLVGFANMLECCRHYEVRHLIYASSSSVYGANAAVPFSVRHNVDHPVSLYAATKKSNELMAHTYSHLFGLPTTGLRFFTVYGPWGRPDMAYFSFTEKMLRGEPIPIFNHGSMKRDFTYIDDIVEGIVRLIERVPEPNPDWDRYAPDPAASSAPYRVYNIGNSRPVGLLQFVRVLERLLGLEAKLELLPMQPGDVEATYADIRDLQEATGFQPHTPIETGLARFVEWYKSYYAVDAPAYLDRRSG